MGKIRVYELAKDLGLGNKELVLKLQEMGYPVKSHSSTIEEFLVREIMERIDGKKAKAPVDSSGARPKVIRRRRKVQEPPPVQKQEPEVEPEPEVETIGAEAPESEAALSGREREETAPMEEQAKDVTPEVAPVSETMADTHPPEPQVELGMKPSSSIPVESQTAKMSIASEEPEPSTKPRREEPEVMEPGIPTPMEKERLEQNVDMEIPIGEKPVEDVQSSQKLEVATPDVIQPEVEKKPPVTKGEAEEPQVIKPEAKEREAVKQEALKLETMKPEPEKIELEKPEAPKPEVVKPSSGKKKKRKKGPKTEGTEAKTAPGAKKKAAADSGPRKKSEPKIKRIEKVTAEPAKIISRPSTPEPPPVTVVPPPAPPQQETVPEHRPKPARQAPQAPAPQPGSRPKPEQERPAGRNAAHPPNQKRDFQVAANNAVPPVEQESRRGKKKRKSRDSSSGEHEFVWKKGSRSKEIIERSELYDQTAGWERSGRSRKTTRSVKKTKKTEITVPKAIKRRIKVVDAITVADMAKKMGIKAGDIIRKLMGLGVMANLNQAIDFDTAALVANEFDYEVEKGSFDEEGLLHVVDIESSHKELRPPVVTVMGHVDHGKTSLLDAIRQTNVIGGEAGGITQHIGAYHVKVEGGQVTFLDTPGHEAFTAMRARGAGITDIVVLIVAADDGVMQQTREAADHARAAGVPIIVAINKVDKADADPDRIKREVSDMGLVPEEWGGDTIFAEISAKTGQGVPELLDLILLQAEMMELKASPDGRAQGRVVEARLDKGRGPVATILIQQGLLNQGDTYVCGLYHGKVRAMFDDKGQRVEQAGPSIPVEIQGISGVPSAGDEFVAVEDEKKSKQISQHRQLRQRENELIKSTKLTLENLFDSIKEGGTKELNLVLKTDVQGSLEAITDAMNKLATEDIKVHLIHSSTGAISETDVMLASASNALVVGFNVRPNTKVQELAEQEKIQIRFYDVIYKLIDEIKEAMVGMLEPIYQEKTLGRAEVRLPYHVSKVGTVAGSAVTDGKIVRGAKARLLRDDVVIYDGKIASLKRFKDDAKEVLTGYECGIGLENYNDIKAGDIIEAYTVEEMAASLD
jgi:translation initiation factor IF-2